MFCDGLEWKYEITDQFYVLHTNCFVKIGECHHVNLG